MQMDHMICLVDFLINSLFLQSNSRRLKSRWNASRRREIILAWSFTQAIPMCISYSLVCILRVAWLWSLGSLILTHLWVWQRGGMFLSLSPAHDPAAAFPRCAEHDPSRSVRCCGLVLLPAGHNDPSDWHSSRRPRVTSSPLLGPGIGKVDLSQRNARSYPAIILLQFAASLKMRSGVGWSVELTRHGLEFDSIQSVASHIAERLVVVGRSRIKSP
jgi:hypothetical protein